MHLQRKQKVFKPLQFRRLDYCEKDYTEKERWTTPVLLPKLLGLVEALLEAQVELPASDSWALSFLAFHFFFLSLFLLFLVSWKQFCTQVAIFKMERSQYIYFQRACLISGHLPTQVSGGRLPTQGSSRCFSFNLKIFQVSRRTKITGNFTSQFSCKLASTTCKFII